MADREGGDRSSRAPGASGSERSPRSPGRASPSQGRYGGSGSEGGPLPAAAPAASPPPPESPASGGSGAGNAADTGEESEPPSSGDAFDAAFELFGAGAGGPLHRADEERVEAGESEAGQDRPAPGSRSRTVEPGDVSGRSGRAAAGEDDEVLADQREDEAPAGE